MYYTPKISIIVPIYNVEKYLARCITSLLNQTLSDIELILVDDESPDSCPQLCDNYAQKDKRIKVIHKKNGGLGYARNSGLDIANGEYSTIVGSRDGMTVGNGSTVVGGSNGMTLGLASTSVGGGFTGAKAENSLALGHKAGTTVKYGTAIGYESVATEEGTIAFGHEAGDISGYTVKYPDKEITTHLGYKKTVPDYDKEPIVTPTTYSDAKYNRLVKVADGVDAHDAATVGQLENAISQVQSVGTNLESTVNKATASSYALAALQPNFSEGETGLGVAVGFGHYHGKTATALGAYYRPSRNVQFNVGTVVGNGNQGFNGGLSFKVGPESKSNTTSTDERIAQLEKRIQELERSKR